MKTKIRQQEIILNHLLTGVPINRVMAFRHYGIGDLRSRIPEVETEYNITIDRRTKPGKRYKEYFIQPKTAMK